MDFYRSLIRLQKLGKLKPFHVTKAETEMLSSAQWMYDTSTFMTE